MPAVDGAEPAGHDVNGVQAEAPAAEKPLAHGEHFELPAAAKAPAAH